MPLDPIELRESRHSLRHRKGEALGYVFAGVCGVGLSWFAMMAEHFSFFCMDWSRADTPGLYWIATSSLAALSAASIVFGLRSYRRARHDGRLLNEEVARHLQTAPVSSEFETAVAEAGVDQPLRTVLRIIASILVVAVGIIGGALLLSVLPTPVITAAGLTGLVWLLLAVAMRSYWQCLGAGTVFLAAGMALWLLEN